MSQSDCPTIYLAARYSRRGELVAHKATLEDLGWEVTSRWLLGNHQAENDQLHPGAAAEQFGSEDVYDLDRAEVFVAFTEEPRQPSTSRGGRHVEFGYALACRKDILVVGPRENVFHCLEGIAQFDTWDEALGVLRTYRGIWQRAWAR